MKIFDNYQISKWAYYKCKDLKDKRIPDKRYYKLITESEYAYKYCKDVKDREEVRKKITDSKWLYMYCLDVKDREEVRKYIK